MFYRRKKVFAASLIIESFDNSRVELAINSTWLNGDGYTFPSYLTGNYPSAMP